MKKLDKDLVDLSKGVNSSYPSVREPAQGTAEVWTIQTIRDLNKTIVRLNNDNKSLNTRLLWLSIVTAILALIQIIVAVLQIPQIIALLCKP